MVEIQQSLLIGSLTVRSFAHAYISVWETNKMVVSLTQYGDNLHACHSTVDQLYRSGFEEHTRTDLFFFEVTFVLRELSI